MTITKLLSVQASFRPEVLPFGWDCMQRPFRFLHTSGTAMRGSLISLEKVEFSHLGLSSGGVSVTRVLLIIT